MKSRFLNLTIRRPPQAVVPAVLIAAFTLAIGPAVRSAVSQEMLSIERLPAADGRGMREEVHAPGEASQEELSLDQAIQLCLLNDPRIRSGFEAIRQADADLVTASLKPNPLLFTDIQLLPLFQQFTPTKQGGPPQQDVQVGCPIDWFVFGKRAAAMANASQGLRISQAEYENLIRLRVTDLTIAYYSLLESEGLVKLTEEDVHGIEQIEATTRKAVEAGGIPVVELNRVRLALAISRRTLREAQAGRTMARARLDALTGGATYNHSFRLLNTFDAPLISDVVSNEDAFTTALSNRPDLAALRLKISQARAQVVLEERKAHPDMTVTFGYTRQYQVQSIGFPDANSWSAALAMPLPIYNRNQGNRLRAESSVVQNQRELQTGELELRSEIDSIIAELQAAQANATAIAEEDLVLSRQVRESIIKAYSLGARSLIDVLDVQRSFRETYRAYITSRANYWRSRTRFEAALSRQMSAGGYCPK